MSADTSLNAKIQKEVAELSQSIFTLMEGFRQLRDPLAESREKVPQATSQLDKISEQTEAATQRMLDTVEQITQREEEVIADATSIKEQIEAGDHNAPLAIADDIIQKANVNLNDAFMIMDSLQFQDITAQQMDHAASLLEDIEAKLHDIMACMGEAGEEEMPGPGPKRDRAYDPHADLFDKKTNQEDIDSLFAETDK
ncbi:MAG: protein phosphatase CheZ [candidate division Zixibacteria bacterium]|nr:protein phosphatase CheZ [candidate division Zixibacteria bacterium]